MRRILVDHNARAPLANAARDAMVGAMERLPGNPSSLHTPGQEARAAVETAREQVAALLDVKPKEITFTSGATESLHLAIHGALKARPGRVLCPATEHHAVLDEVESLPNHGVLPVLPDGTVQLDALEAAVAAGGASCLAIMAANNETGVLHPLAKALRVAREAGLFTVVDAAQWAGRMPFPPGRWGADAVALSACKFGGPPGVGALWLAPGTAMRWLPPHHGGSQELGRRPGTENLFGVVGMGAAAAACKVDWEARVLPLRNALEQRLAAAFPDAVIHGRDAPRLANTCFMAFPGVDVQLLLVMLDGLGISAGTGSACVSGSMKPSHVLTGMGLPKVLASSSVRFSLSPENSLEDVDAVLQALVACVPKARL